MPAPAPAQRARLSGARGPSGQTCDMPLLKRVGVTVVGLVLLAVGAALMVLPGPGILVIFAGLAVLAVEYAWARKLVVGAGKRAREAQEAAVASPTRTAGSVLTAVGMSVVGVLMLVVDDIRWPVLDGVLSSVWGPVTGVVLVFSSLILLTTTVLALRMAKGQKTTSDDSRSSRTGGATAR